MALPNSEKITSQIAMLPDAALKQMAMMHKSDPYVLPLIVSEDTRRKQMRQAAQAQMAGMPQPKVNDAAVAQMGNVDVMGNVTGFARGGHVLPENHGIGALPAPNMQHMADGGIAGFDESTNAPITKHNTEKMDGASGAFNYAQSDGGAVLMAGGGVPGYAKGVALPPDLEKYIDEQAKLNNIPPSALRAVIQAESEGKVDAQSKTSSAQGLMQLINRTFTKGGGDPEKRKDPFENVRVGAKVLGQDAAALRGNLKREVTPEELYATHVLGRGTGSRLLQADPNMTMAEVLKSADPANADKIISSNSKLFGNGKKTVGEVMQTFSNKMASAMPVATAQAANVPPKTTAPSTAPEVLSDKERAALEQPAFMTPSSGKGRQEGRLSETIKSGEAPRQMALGASDLPYNIAGAPVDIATTMMRPFGYKEKEPALGSEHLKRLGTKYLGREAESTDPTLRGFRTAGEFAGMAFDPFAATRKVAQTAEGLESLALAQRAKAAEAEARVQTPVNMRLEPPRTEPPVMVVDAQGRAIPADTLARGRQAVADEAAVGAEAAKAAELEKQAAAYPGTAQRAEMLRTAEMADKARGTAAAAQTGNLAESGIKTLTNADKSTGINTSGDDLSKFYDLGPSAAPRPSDVIAAAKEVTPEKKKGGFEDEDYLMMGLNLLANKDPNFFNALGESGLKTVAAKKEREKRETDLEYKDIMKKYYGALGTKAETEAKQAEAGTKYNAAARQHAMDNISREMQKWEQSLGGVTATPQQIEAKRRELASFYFPLAGLELPSTMTATAGVAIPEGVKVTRG